MGFNLLPRPDLVPEEDGSELEVFQLTQEDDVPSSHIYMEAQIFHPDSERFVLHRSAHPHGSDPEDPEHRYLLCDLSDDGNLVPLTEELGATAPSVSPDGRYMYYFVDETEPGGGRLTLKRVDIDGSDRETLHVLDGPIPDTSFRFSRPYSLSTISSDGKRIAISGFLGDGSTADAPWGLLVYDLDDLEARLILHGPTWCNVHPQYCRSRDPDERRDILIQENHGCEYDASGRVTQLAGGSGADIHVIRDDGTRFRTMPWGRDGNEFCQGHQCWRGRSHTAITSTSTRQPPEAQLIEGRPVADGGHEGKDVPGGWRNHLTRDVPSPDFYHFATDIEGRRLITDCGPQGPEGSVVLFDLPEERGETVSEGRTVAMPRSSWVKESHIHPFLSPDGRYGFFNSDESGTLQAYMVRGWE